MHKKILLEAFEKAKKDQVKEGVLSPSTNSSAKVLSMFIEAEFNFPFSSRSLRDYHNKAVKELDSDIEIKQPKVLNGLCSYLEYENYADFVVCNSKQKVEVDNPKTSPQEGTGFINGLPMNVKIGFAISIVLIAITLLFFLIPNQPTVMKWEGDHYVKASFSAEEIQNGTLKLYKEDRIENFKRITAECNTVFFNPDRSVKIWYGKNVEGKLEYFTDLGLHPTTGKTLKPITKYMITTHICQDY